ncbi:MAG: Fic family protein [Crocinitomicaceae bacterium]|nr:Fic family protein [Crocinitomicaceae bacterium]
MKALLKTYRELKQYKTKELANFTGIDQALISKFESGKRIPTKAQVIKLSEVLEIPLDKILPEWVKEKVLAEVRYEPYAVEGILLAQEAIQPYGDTPEYSTSLSQKLAILDQLQRELNALRTYDSYRIAQALELEYTFESNRIEGNTLTLRETDLVINEGLTVSGKSMREHLEAVNHQEAISYIKELVQRKIQINEREVLAIHNLILRGIQPEYAGKYRDIQVMIKGSTHMPPQPFLVKDEMIKYFEWYEQQKDKLHPVLLAAEMHERLVTIHPFVDGNGRTSRLIMNLILLSKGYVIANIKGDYETRMKYYDALEKVQTNQSQEAFHHFIVDVEIDCLKRYLTILGA